MYLLYELVLTMPWHQHRQKEILGRCIIVLDRQSRLLVEMIGMVASAWLLLVDCQRTTNIIPINPPDFTFHLLTSEYCYTLLDKRQLVKGPVTLRTTKHTVIPNVFVFYSVSKHPCLSGVFLYTSVKTNRLQRGKSGGDANF